MPTSHSRVHPITVQASKYHPAARAHQHSSALLSYTFHCHLSISPSSSLFHRFFQSFTPTITEFPQREAPARKFLPDFFSQSFRNGKRKFYKVLRMKSP